MTKDEILEKSRRDNGDKDVFDLDVQRRAATAAYFSSFGLCAFVSVLSLIFTGRVSVQCWMIFFGMLTVAFFVKFFKMKKRHELFVALGYFVIFVALTIVFILELTGKLGSGNLGSSGLAQNSLSALNPAAQAIAHNLEADTQTSAFVLGAVA